MLTKALADVKETLAVDGYELSYHQSQEGDIDIFIKAGPHACEDCLLPKPILEKIIQNALDENCISYLAVNIHLP